MSTPFLEDVIQLQNLSSAQIRELFLQMIEGKLSEAQTGGILVALRMKGETLGELLEATRVVREKAIPFAYSILDLVDNCGTGGDGAGTFNISTLAAFIAASAGAKIAKHGNRSASSRSGSADVLEALGIEIELSLEKIARSIERFGFGFLFAPRFHPALRTVAKVRRELGVRTLFNLIGPLANPASVSRQLVGVFRKDLLVRFGEVLRELKTEKAWIVHGEDGLDEITLTGQTSICELSQGKLHCFLLDPREFGFNLCRKEDLAGGNAQENAKIIEQILRGEVSPRRDIALLNSAALLYLSGLASSFEEGISKSQESLESGKAFRLLQDLRENQ